ncbi:MAG: ATP synthase F1 subunit epsilon [Lachnospiraceae bacterium]|nr:ATP synthase F1 subunit epsilon [Lachnospiraceae bacterium]
MNTFSLRIVACNRVFYDGECEALIFPGYDGQMEILAHHEQMTTMVKIGEIRYKLPQCDWQKAVVSDGLIQVEYNHVNVIVYSAEKPEEIDAFRAEAALERAREQLQEKQSIMEYHVSRASLARAMARLKTAGKYEIK